MLYIHERNKQKQVLYCVNILAHEKSFSGAESEHCEDKIQVNIINMS